MSTPDRSTAADSSPVRVVVIEDEPTITRAIADRLTAEGWEVSTALDGPSGVRTVAEVRPDLVVLDVMLPGFDGLEVCRRIQADEPVPVLMLTARDDETDMLVGLGVGADDYMTKPFSMTELTARIRAVLRRIRPGLADDRVNHADIIMDRVAHRVSRAGKEVHLGPTEFRLLDHFLKHPGRVFSREQLLDAVWGSDVYVEARTVDVHVGRLRKALNVEGTVNPIRTVRSAGYSLDLNN
jgi:two-component system phosphate regulon response regulator PhoB